jgi:tetratricopeptide (TPR) repeat protein
VESPVALRPEKRVWARAWNAAVSALLLGAVLLAYLPAVRGGFLWDDNAHVTSPQLQPLHGLWRIWFEPGATQQYYPLLHSAFWLEHRLWGDSVTGYHLANIALHASAAWLVFLILGRLSFPAPALAAFIFALHPVCVESVAWISEQKNTLSAVFYLGSALLYLGFDGSRRRGLFAWAFALYGLALLTKSVTATLPAALLVVLWWRRGSLAWGRDVRPLVPWFAVGALSGLFTAWMEARFIGAEGADFSFGAAQRLLLAGRAAVFYARKLLWPADLMFVYPRWDPGREEAAGAACLLLCAAALAVLLVAARRARGPLAGFLFFAGTLFPALGFVNVYPFRFSFVADHFQYLASLGLIVPAAWLLHRALGRSAWGVALLAAIPALLGVLSFRQASDYRDSETLYRSSLARNPSAWLLHYNLAVTLGLGPAHLGEAIAEYEATLRLKPDHWEAHNNLASALRRLPGRTGEAIAHYEAALSYHPDYAEAHNNLGTALEEVPGRLAEAKGHLRTAIRLRPDYDAAHANLGILLMHEPGSLGEAVRELEEAVRLAPGTADYRYDLGNALSLDRGRLPEAVDAYREAIRLRPDYAEAHSNLGVALSHMPGRLAEAISEDEAALRLDPSSGDIRANLANALARVPGRDAEAAAEYRAALAIDPSDAQSHYGLGLVLSRTQGGRAQAESEFESAVRLDPASAEAQFALGIMLAMEGRRGEARTHLERALELRPGFGLARDALARLGRESP